MTYYNRNDEKLKLNIGNLTYLDSGCCADVWHDDSVIFKKYFSHTEDFYRLRPQIFDVLKSINSPHLIEIFDIYRHATFFKHLKNKICNQDFCTDAYIAKYYSDNSINPLFEKNDYILDNFREIEILFNIFANNSIMVDDVKRENSILSSNGIVLIDPDTFHFSDDLKEVIFVKNKRELAFLFRDMCFHGLRDLSEKQIEDNHICKKIDVLFSEIKIDENTDVTYEISKRLQYVKRPIDYFMK